MKLLIIFLSLGLILTGCKNDEDDKKQAENQFPQVFDNQSSSVVVVSATKATDDDKAIGDKDKEVAAKACEAFDKDAFTPGEDGAVYVYVKDGDNKGDLVSEYKATEKDFTEVTEKVEGEGDAAETKVSAETKDAGDDPAACPKKEEDAA